MFTHPRVAPSRFSRQACSFLSNQFHIQKSMSMSTLTSRNTAGSNESSTDRRPGMSQYRLIEDVEDLDRYHPGGYHPLQVGDALDNARYRVIDKLGYGGYSTIWLAQDLRKARYVAVKVITADASGYTQEARLISSLGNAPSRPGRGVIPPLLDEFWVAGPNGRHKCIVTPPAQMSLFDTKESSKLALFRPKVARSIIAQLIHGVAFLHRGYYSSRWKAINEWYTSPSVCSRLVWHPLRGY